jgi:hypothetical protein
MNNHPMHKILDAGDVLKEAQSCIECVFMAASDLDGRECEPIQAVVNIASKKIDEATALLDEYLKASGFGSDEAYERAAERLRDYDHAVAARNATKPDQAVRPKRRGEPHA